MPYTTAAKRAAKDYVGRLRQQTHCANCGEQPIEWHREEHVAHPNWRVGHLTALGFPVARIDAEIAECVALCRRCHMKEDGRSAALTAARPRKLGDRIVLPAPCAECLQPSRRRCRGLCSACWHRARRRRIKGEAANG